MSEKHPIIGHGELYVDNIDKRYTGFNKKRPHAYLDSKISLIKDISVIQKNIQAKEEIFLQEKVICVRMEPKFEAKSYSPDMLLSIDGIMPIGGRKYKISDVKDNHVKAKLYFAKISDSGLENLKNILESGQKDSIATWENQISAIRTINLLTPSEKISGFSENWETGLVEIVLHPYIWNNEFAMKQFLNLLNLAKGKYSISGYENGPLFCSAECTQETLKRLVKFNPLRTIHPMEKLNLPEMRSGAILAAPMLPTYRGKPQIKIGVFDGGTDSTLPHLKDYVSSHDLTSISKDSTCLSHGTAVCGAVLYGAFNNKSTSKQLATPIVSIDSYRVLPQAPTGNVLEDNGLYPIIDKIEEVVNNNPKTSVYNLSFGPCGAILDDDISRFTYALDNLSMLKNHPLFCVAVGNDGNLPSPLNRVQSPADLANGLGIGSYDFNIKKEKTRADYSCVGPGREGCKVKPDILEFGGSSTNPVILLSTTKNKLTTGYGTSFSSPIVAGKIGKIMALSPEISAHMARTLLIHTATASKELKIEETGFGFCAEDISNVLNCEDNKVVVLYNGKIAPKQNLKLPILLPDISGISCMAKITWTISTLSKLNPNDVDSYTCNAIEDYFYPNDRIYNYAKDKITKKAEIDTDAAKNLLKLGFSRSDLPASKPANRFLSEEKLRSQRLKWDTIIRKKLNMRTKSLNNPFFVLHGMDRNISDISTMQYFAAITIEIAEYPGILYDDVLMRYHNLSPISIKTQNQLFVKI